MTDTDLDTTAPPADSVYVPRKRAGLSGMVLAELRSLAESVGVSANAGMRKGDLIAAIKERQGRSDSAAAPTSLRDAAGSDSAASNPAAPDPAVPDPVASGTSDTPSTSAEPTVAPRRTRARRGGSGSGSDTDGAGDVGRTSEASNSDPDTASRNGHGSPAAGGDSGGEDGAQQGGRRSRRDRQNRREGAVGGEQRDGDRPEAGSSDTGRDESGTPSTSRSDTDERPGNRQNGGNQNGGNQGGRERDDDNGGEGRGRRGGRRFRERRRGRDRGDRGVENGQVRDDRELEVREDDVLQPVAGILDVLDNYAFVRTSGYLAGPNDVYVSMNLVRKNGMRRGDAITGAVRLGREGEQQQGNRTKFNPLVRIDTINGGDAEAARARPEFTKLTPLYPNQRLRLETTPNALTARIIDLVMPIGKGQRALIVSPPKAGKTSVLQAIANAIAVNNPECHLMVVLVDERPEEVTDMQRSVRGEVISSTFDCPPADHTAVAELAIERAKRLVESGTDVVVLLDSITRLGRAYNNSSPASGRILSGGVDSTALYPPKRFLGAARNIENGGSLTIIATAMVETGSTGDTVIFEEFKGTGNAELKLDRKIAERRVFPAVDVNPSGTRKDELIMAPDEYQVALKLRRVLSGLDSHQAIDLLTDRLRKTKSNAEFMMQVAKTAPGGMAAPDET